MSLSESPPDPAYFLYHSIGLYPDKAGEMEKAFADFSRVWASGDDSQWPGVLGMRRVFIDLWSHLIDAPAGTLTTTENVTTGLYSVIGALPLRYLLGRRVLVGADCFPSLHFLLAGLAGRMGFRLETVPLRAGEAWVREEDMIARWGPDVGLALLTFVTSTASYRCDLDMLAAHAKAMGSLVALDLTQGVGIVPFSLRDHDMDVVLSTSLKWLCGTPGAGILQVARPLLAESAPELRGWFSQDDPFSWDLDAFAYAADARRFDNGTPSVLACVGSVPALQWHAAQDKAALLAHNRTLAGAIMAGAQALDLQVISPAGEDRRGGSVMLRLPQKTDPVALVAALRAKNVHVDCRGQVLRLSPGVVTQQAHVARLLDALRCTLHGST